MANRYPFRRFQPPGGTAPLRAAYGQVEIDWRNAFSRGLRFVFAPVGGGIRDLYLNRVPTGSNVMNPASGLGGAGYAGTGSTTYFQYPHSPSDNLTVGMTAFARVVSTSSSASQSHIINRNFASGVVPIDFALKGKAASTDGFGFYSVPWVKVLDAFDSIAGDRKLHDVAGTYSVGAANIRCYVDGAKSGTDKGTTASIPSNSTGFTVGSYKNDSTYFAGQIYCVYVWDREFSASEVRAFTANPYQILRQRVRHIFVPVAAGGTTHDETAASTLTVTDTSSETATFPETATSTLSVTDTGSETATFPETSTSTLSITDTSEGTTAKVGASTSTLTVTDAASESAVFADSATSTLTVTDAGSETATFPESATSTLSVTDTSLGTAGLDKSATSTLSITDASSESATFAAAATSTLTVTDSSSELATFLKTAPDSIIFTDTATASGGEEIAAQRGGSSLSLRKMRELERLQMLQRDDDEIIALISRLME